MRTSRFTAHDILESFAHRPVLSKAELLQHCGCSAMTAWRLLCQVGYYTSYNYNARYYTLASTPRFDPYGLWAYRDIRFSRWGTLPQTIAAVVERSPIGMTAHELADLLRMANLKPILTRLTLERRLERKKLDDVFVYMAAERSRHEQQLQGRQSELALRAAALALPEPQQIIALLVEMIRHPRQTPRQWARRLARRDIDLGIPAIRAVMEHYQLTVKKGLWSA
jgi:hypothetical protein